MQSNATRLDHMGFHKACGYYLRETISCTVLRHLKSLLTTSHTSPFSSLHVHTPVSPQRESKFVGLRCRAGGWSWSQLRGMPGGIYAEPVIFFCAFCRCLLRGPFPFPLRSPPVKPAFCLLVVIRLIRTVLRDGDKNEDCLSRRGRAQQC